MHLEKCEKIRNPTVGMSCFGRLPHPASPYKMGGRRASRATLGRDHRMRWRAGGSELALWKCASDAPPTSFGRAVGEENECRGGTGRPRPIQMAVREATKTPPSHGRIPDFFTLFRVHEPRRQSQCHGDSIRRRWHYFKISTPATIQRGPGGLQSTATTNHHHRLVGSRRWLRCVSPVRADAARPLRAT